MVLNTRLPACQAPLPESDQAAATATWAFIHSFGSIWGVVIQRHLQQPLQRPSLTVTDLTAQASLTSGRAYEHATSAFVDSFSGNLRERIIGLYTESLQTVWQVAIAFCGLAFLLVFLEREVPLRKELDTEYGLEEQNRKERKLKSGGEKEEDARTEPVAASNQGHIV